MVLRIKLSSLIIDNIFDLPSTVVAMLDFDELQEFPKISSWATKTDFICDLMGTQNHPKTVYFPEMPGCHSGNWTTTVGSEADAVAACSARSSSPLHQTAINRS